jgi:hypothetical protein
MSPVIKLLTEELVWDMKISLKLIFLFMKAVRSSETPLNIYHATRRNIPEDSHHIVNMMFIIIIVKCFYRISPPYVPYFTRLHLEIIRNLTT